MEAVGQLAVAAPAPKIPAERAEGRIPRSLASKAPPVGLFLLSGYLTTIAAILYVIPT
jgi:hypothetical protein